MRILMQLFRQDIGQVDPLFCAIEYHAAWPGYICTTELDVVFCKTKTVLYFFAAPAGACCVIQLLLWVVAHWREIVYFACCIKLGHWDRLYLYIVKKMRG